jgi:fatty-acyl-CoA synthase
MQRRFDPHRVLAAVQEHRATGLVVVPVMLEKLLGAMKETPYDTSPCGSSRPAAARCRGTSWSGCRRLRPGALQPLRLDEVAYAAVAGPEDLAADPRTAGRPPLGVTLRVVGRAGPGRARRHPGRIFVGSGLSFEGYTDGSDKDRLDGLVSTGDLGVLHESGRLTVLGRDDDMVVIGGENVYPGQVEDVLAEDPSVAEVAVVDEQDPAYGVRLWPTSSPRRARRWTRRRCRSSCAASWPASPCRAR